MACWNQRIFISVLPWHAIPENGRISFVILKFLSSTMRATESMQCQLYSWNYATACRIYPYRRWRTNIDQFGSPHIRVDSREASALASTYVGQQWSNVGRSKSILQFQQPLSMDVGPRLWVSSMILRTVITSAKNSIAAHFRKYGITFSSKNCEIQIEMISFRDSLRYNLVHETHRIPQSFHANQFDQRAKWRSSFVDIMQRINALKSNTSFP